MVSVTCTPLALRSVRDSQGLWLTPGNTAETNAHDKYEEHPIDYVDSSVVGVCPPNKTGNTKRTDSEILLTQ